MPAVAKAFETISTAKVSKSAAEARELMFLRPTDQIVMNRDRLLHEAKARALALVEGYAPPPKPEFRLPGESGKVAMEGVVAGFRKTGMATPHDAVVAGELATVLSGGEADLIDVVTEDKMMELERAAFLRLLKTPATLARGRAYARNRQAVEELRCRPTTPPCATCASCCMSCMGWSS